ncbi:hypothetical protein BHE74_00058335 [Ensete ventricosum]|nr:hypothetical protein GW17_00053899 [Ensete ventricosum]RWW36629.1 hypothetical protein BHE74_00058335 [Ensete ventricosum]
MTSSLPLWFAFPVSNRTRWLRSPIFSLYIVVRGGWFRVVGARSEATERRRRRGRSPDQIRSAMSLFGLGRYRSAPSRLGAQLRKHIDATLGSGNLREAVRLPPGEDLNEWLAVNSNALSILEDGCF